MILRKMNLCWPAPDSWVKAHRGTEKRTKAGNESARIEARAESNHIAHDQLSETELEETRLAHSEHAVPG